MSNVYVSPMASPSFECLSAAEETQPNQLPKTCEGIKQDENENEVFESTTKTSKKNIKGMRYIYKRLF